MLRPHLRDLEPAGLRAVLCELGVRHPTALTERIFIAVHRGGAFTWEEAGLGAALRERLDERIRFGPLLTPAGSRTAADGTRKFLFGLGTGEVIETVLIHNLRAKTLCVSSQAGCALGCAFCATGRIGLSRNLTSGEILESIQRTAMAIGVRISDIVFMGQGEPLHNYEHVMSACRVLTDRRAAAISAKRITISTAGLVPQIRRFAAERQPWRLYLSLHSALQETRSQLMPIARVHPLPELVSAMRTYQETCDVRWVTLQYVAIPDVNMDRRHMEALRRELAGLRYILNVIPYNDAAGPFRSPSWTEVRAFTTLLRELGCPVKIRYSGGKQEGMGCGQLSAEQVALVPTGGHVQAPPGIFSN